jgi:uncharacterized protein with PIN domain
MIGTITWVGHVTCKDCTKQVTDIHHGEGRKTLNALGWRFRRRVWRCPDCHKKHNAVGYSSHVA